MAKNTVTNKQRREESDARIIDAAIKNFGKNGYTHSSIATIAKDAGVSPGLITSRYSSKEKLFETAFNIAYQERYIDCDSFSDARAYLVALIDATFSLYNKNKDAFDFISKVYIGFDKPEHLKLSARENFKKSKAYELLLQGQKDGIIKKGDVVILLDAFLSQAYIQVEICNKYDMEMPSTAHFLANIMYEDLTKDVLLRRQLIELFLQEYQSVWLIKVDDLTLDVIVSDDNQVPPNSVETASGLRSYEEARNWYIDEYVVGHSKKMLREKSRMDYVLSQLSDKDSFFIEYGRKIEGIINSNQIRYDKIVKNNGEIEYIAMGFRNVDVAKNSETDDLTGLLTRPGFFAKAEEMLELNPDAQFDILISDIIDFKKINETYGTAVADKILRWQGDYLSALDIDGLLMGRYGGDQIVIFGKHEIIANVMGYSYKEEFAKAEKENGLPSITVKFGIYEDIKHDRSIVSSCDKAHMALNSIKHNYNKDLEYYSTELKTKLEKHRRIEESMHDSLKNGDFKVYYQPKHDAQTGKLAGAEALVRWIHPEYGFMSPGDFIPIFEHNGFIVENDRFVWNRTCENLRRWMDSGIDVVPISVNASKLTMERTDIVDNMKRSVMKNALLPDTLHIEITETLMSEDPADLVDKLNRIRDAGFRVELDDFGSGYSSMNVLSTLPIDVVKLDMSFMQQFGDEKRAKILVACVNLAKELGFNTVSEGVEHEEQREALGDLGVDMIQGYLYSKPLPEEEFEEYLKKHMK